MATLRASWTPKAPPDGHRQEDFGRHMGDVLSEHENYLVVVDDHDYCEKRIRRDHVTRTWRGRHRNTEKEPQHEWGKSF